MSVSTDCIQLSIILPSYNDAQIINVFLHEIYAFLSTQDGQHEIILVDDGGKDQLHEVYLAHCQQLPAHIELNLIQLSRNFGKEAALSAGLHESKGETVIIMDSDGQHPVSVLNEMIQLFQNTDVDMIAAVQAQRQHENKLLKFLKHHFYQFMQDSQRYQLEPNAGDFRVMKRKVVDALLALPERQRFMKGLYSWVGFKTIYYPFQADERFEGESTFNFARLFELALVGITSFSLKPLRWITRVGFLVSIMSFFYGLAIVADTLFFEQELDGWPTLAAGIMFSAGLQLICLGVIGEYIGRIYEEVKERPIYIIDKKWTSKQ